ncbi:MAG: serine/threonine protein kinase [Planctomycetota bacterium]|nr:serine/threonine protein kinase [Planctomycetota bacterium]
MSSTSISAAVLDQHPHWVLAIKRNQLTRQQIEEAIAVQQSVSKVGVKKTIDEILVQKGYIDADALAKLVEESKPQERSKRFGNFEIVGKLGEGSMGKVYKARQIVTKRIVALKVLFPELAKDQNMFERFLREARAVGQLHHPNIVSGLDVACVNGLYYICMEYVEGEALDKKLQKAGGKLPEAEVLEYCRQTALGLHHAHQNSYLHRDVKPENIIVTTGGQVKVTDLGLARSMGEHQVRALTQEGVSVGTPYYISPEQAQGLKDLRPASDLYSLGVMMFECLTGKLPFDSENFYEVMLMHVNNAPPDVRTMGTPFSEDTARVVMRLLEKEPARRYPDGEALADELQRILGQLQAAPPLKAKRMGGDSRPGRTKGFNFEA